MLKIRALQGTIVLVHSLPTKSKGRLAWGCLILWLHKPAMFMTSLIQTVGHKIMAFLAMVLWLSDISINRQDEKSCEKLYYVFCSYQYGLCCFFSLVPVNSPLIPNFRITVRYNRTYNHNLPLIKGEPNQKCQFKKGVSLSSLHPPIAPPTPYPQPSHTKGLAGLNIMPQQSITCLFHPENVLLLPGLLCCREQQQFADDPRYNSARAPAQLTRSEAKVD